MSYTSITGMRSNRYPLMGMGDSGDGLGGCGCGTGTDSTPNTSTPAPEEQVSVKWKYGAMGLGALLVAQFFWWDAKAPQVLRRR